MVWDRRSTLDGWERISLRIQGWFAGHPTAMRRLRLARVLLLWAGLALLVTLLISQPRLRESASTMLSLYWLLIAWFLLCRTKTLSWRFVSGWFAGSLLWSILIAKFTSALALWVTTRHIGRTAFAGNVRADGPGIAIAGLAEESLKVLPLAVFALLAARRIHRFALVDYLLLGFAGGLAFQSCEEAARRLAAHVVRPGVLALLGDLSDRGPASGYPQYGLSPLSGWSSSSNGLAEFPGHHITTSIVALSAGFGVWLWRAGYHRSVVAATGLRACGIALPILALWIAVGVHGGYNAVAAISSSKWTANGSPVPWPIRIGWQVGLHGKHAGLVLLALWFVAMVLDSRRRRRAEVAESLVSTAPFAPIELGRASRPAAAEPNSTDHAGSPETGLATEPIPIVPPPVPPPSNGRARRALRVTVGDLRWLGRYTVADIRRSLRAHARRALEPGAAALIRGRSATSALRAEKADAMAAGAPNSTVPAWTLRRLTAGLAVAGIAAAVLLVAPAWARQIGPSLAAHQWVWFAGLLDQLAKWWDSQPFAMQMVYVFGIAALIALSGGSFGLAMFGSGIFAYVAEHGHGEADFVRDPAKSTRAYLASTTPQALVLDLLEFGLTFAPSGAVGAGAGRAGREALQAAAERAAAERLAAERLAAEKAAAEKAAEGKAATVAPVSLEGQSNYVVWDAQGQAITDIDRIEKGTLWEEKSATWASNTPKWIKKHIADKFDAYLRARAAMPGYENAPIGFHFTAAGADPAFKAAVEQAVEALRQARPDVTIYLRWTP